MSAEQDAQLVALLSQPAPAYGFVGAVWTTARIAKLIKEHLLKRYHPAEFLASVLSNGKGFYTPLAYTLECRRLGIGFLSPNINLSRDKFFP